MRHGVARGGRTLINRVEAWYSAIELARHGCEPRIRTWRIVINSHAPPPRGSARNGRKTGIRTPIARFRAASSAVELSSYGQDGRIRTYVSRVQAGSGGHLPHILMAPNQGVAPCPAGLESAWLYSLLGMGWSTGLAPACTRITTWRRTVLPSTNVGEVRFELTARGM